MGLRQVQPLQGARWSLPRARVRWGVGSDRCSPGACPPLSGTQHPRRGEGAGQVPQQVREPTDEQLGADSPWGPQVCCWALGPGWGQACLRGGRGGSTPPPAGGARVGILLPQGLCRGLASDYHRGARGPSAPLPQPSRTPLGPGCGQHRRTGIQVPDPGPGVRLVVIFSRVLWGLIKRVPFEEPTGVPGKSIPGRGSSVQTP